MVGLFVLKRDEPREKMLLGRRLDDGDDGRYRILVVANETLSGRALRQEISKRGRGGDAQLKVVCPALNSKIRHWTNEEDAGARDRPAAPRAVCWPSCGARASTPTGDIGDDDPVQAMEDGLRRFHADEVIISTHPPGRSNWLEHDVVERARARFDIPVTHVVVDLDREGSAAPRSGYLTVRVPFMPACSWPGTLQ